MSKKRISNNWTVAIIVCMIFISSVLTVLFSVLDIDDKQLYDLLSVLMYIFWSCSLLLLILQLFNIWIVETDINGISYKNLLKFIKFKRFIKWEEIDEIEIIKVLCVKGIYITTKYYSYGEKRFLNVKKNKDVLIISGKGIEKDIKQYYEREIISGRTFKNEK